MGERQNYNTKARKCILDFLQTQNGTVSAADIAGELEKSGVAVNKATVYRCLNKMTAEKSLLKFTDGKTHKAVYRLADSDSCDDHLHIKCTVCGKLIHLDCGFMHDIKAHLSERHGFTLDCDGSILYGICSDCKRKSKEL